MPTTGKTFLSINSNTAAVATPPNLAGGMVNGLGAKLLDRFNVDLSAAPYAKNGCVVLSLAASTPQTVDLTALSGVTAGDTGFALANELIFHNLAAFDVIVSPGASNPFNGPLAGTAPTFTVPANAHLRWHSPAGWAVSGSVKTLKFDPGSNACAIALCVGGA